MNFRCLLVFLVCLPIVGFSQTEETRKFILGGGVNFNYQQRVVPFAFGSVPGTVPLLGTAGDDARSIFLSVSPYIGKQVSSNWILGFEVGYELNYFRNEDFFIIVTNNIPQEVDFQALQHEGSLGLFGRYTVNPANKFQFYLQPSVSFGYIFEQTSLNGIPSEDQTAYIIAAAITPGFLYQFNERFRVLARAGLINYAFGESNLTLTEERFSTFNFGFNPASVALGIEFCL